MNKNKINKNLKIQFNNNYLLYKYIKYVKFILNYKIFLQKLFI